MRYHPTYSRPTTLPVGAHFTLAQALVALADEEQAGAVTLDAIRGVCTFFQVGADLSDEAGRPAGWVRADGSYRVNEACEVAA